MDRFIKPDPFADIEIPDALQDSLEKHRGNLLRLIENLRTAGLSEAQIETSVSVMVESYKTELLRAIKTMVR